MEQVIKLTGRIVKVFPTQSGVSARTGNAWMSQEFLFEYHAWSGAYYPNRIVCRIFGEDRIKQWAPKELEDNVTVILSPDASEGKEGRWFNEIRVTNFKRANEPQPAQQAPQGANAPATGQSPTPPFPEPQNPSNRADDDLPF
jgi:hypothetical protein